MIKVLGKVLENMSGKTPQKSAIGKNITDYQCENGECELSPTNFVEKKKMRILSDLKKKINDYSALQFYPTLKAHYILPLKGGSEHKMFPIFHGSRRILTRVDNTDGKLEVIKNEHFIIILKKISEHHERESGNSYFL